MGNGGRKIVLHQSLEQRTASYLQNQHWKYWTRTLTTNEKHEVKLYVYLPNRHLCHQKCFQQTDTERKQNGQQVEIL